MRELAKINFKTLARTISLIENEVGDYENILKHLQLSSVPVIGITGAPGAGKSTLTDVLIEHLVSNYKTVGVLCVDPSSPFNKGALLGDRIRMSSWYNHPQVFIRSLSSKGSMGGLNPKIIEITDVMKHAGFDNIIIETVGVGQSEIEIAGLADITVVVLVPEGGDEIQTMKSGLMEVADIFVINKADRPGADALEKNLQQMLAPAYTTKTNPAIIKTIATQKSGVDRLVSNIMQLRENNALQPLKQILLADKAYQLIQQKKMKNINREQLAEALQQHCIQPGFNLYKFVEKYY